jgi:hypothetical protein
MSNSSKKQYSPTPYTAKEFDSALNAMLAKYGISAQTKEQASSASNKQKVYEVKMIPPVKK